MKKSEEIRSEVDRFYTEIAKNKRGTKVKSSDLYESLGYDRELLDQLPEEIQMGLSCGNPLENLLLRDGETLLDLGSGTGVDVFLTRLKFPKAGTLYGIDVLQAMVDRANDVRDKKGFEGVEFVRGEVTDLPFEDGSISKVISNCVINLEPDKQKTYDEIYRVLEDGGMFIVSDIILKKPLPAEVLETKDIYGT